MRALPLEFRMAWANRLRQAMERKAMKADELAAQSDRSVSIIYRWLGGQIPELPDIQVVAKLLDEDPAWLLWGERGKAKPRPGRGFRSLALVLSFGAGVGLWPSPSTAASTRALDIVRLIGSWKRIRNNFSHFALGLCPA